MKDMLTCSLPGVKQYREAPQVTPLFLQPTRGYEIMRLSRGVTAYISEVTH